MNSVPFVLECPMFRQDTSYVTHGSNYTNNARVAMRTVIPRFVGRTPECMIILCSHTIQRFSECTVGTRLSVLGDFLGYAGKRTAG